MRLLPSSAFALALVAVGVLSCSGSHGRPGGTEERYQLARIGGASVPRSVPSRTCDGAPVAGWYRLRGDGWVSVDTLAGCNAPGSARVAVVAGEGRLERLGDTLRFHVSDTTIGMHGLVGLGWQRGDTLIVAGSDEEGGNFTFVRRP